MTSQRQKGLALIIFAVILVLAAAFYLVLRLDSGSITTERHKKTAAALTEAKIALIGDAVSQPLTMDGLLRLPDLGHGINPSDLSEGSSISTFTGNMKNYSVLGKLPWKTLNVAPLKDGYGECLWYAVSGKFKKIPVTDILNWDTQGQIDVIDQNGNILAANLAAVIIAPSFILPSQNRFFESAVYSNCGGNYDARNYLDTYILTNAVSGEVNYFSSNPNNRVASNANNKAFVLASNNFYNDQFAFVTVDEIFSPLIKRSDFFAQISALLSDAYFQTVAITGNKGTDSVVCSSLLSTNQSFCKNWKEMLLLTELPASLPSRIITIGGLPAGPCARVLIFGGQKTLGQVRASVDDKIVVANYLENTNLVEFNTPVANGSNFNGALNFSPNNPSADVLRCL